MKRALTLLSLSLAALMLASCAELGFTAAGNTPAVQKIPDDITEVERGMLAMQAGDLEKAERYFIRALDEDPKNPHANLNMGVLYHNTGHFDLAEQYYKVVIDLNSRIVPRFSGMAQAEGGESLTLSDIARRNLELLQRQTGQEITP